MSDRLAPIAPLSAEELDVLTTEIQVAIGNWDDVLRRVQSLEAAAGVRQRLTILWSLHTHFAEARQNLPE